jgi:hypothetical protein
MSTTFTWAVEKMICAPEFEGHNNVVTSVTFVCSGTDGNKTSEIRDTCSIPYQPDGFTAFSDLTLDQVLAWLDSLAINRPYIEQLVQEKITDQYQNLQPLDPPWVY